MRSQLNVLLDATTAEELRALAERVGAPIGDLADLLLRRGMKQVVEPRLMAWAAALPSRSGRTGGALTKAEKAVLDAFARMPLEGGPVPGCVFSAAELTRAAGLPTRAAADALTSLLTRGRVHEVHGDERDRWGRPLDSLWWATPREGVDQSGVLSAVVDLRRELVARRVEPLAVALMERAARRTAGWSIAALRLPQGVEAESYDVTAAGALEWFAARWPLAL